MARLTTRTLAQSTAITPTTLIHIVTTGDTSQNSSGSSYKAELSQLFWSGNCVTDFYVTNIHGCSPINFQSEVVLNSGLTISGDTLNISNSFTPSRSVNAPPAVPNLCMSFTYCEQQYLITFVSSIHFVVIFITFKKEIPIYNISTWI